MRELDTSSPVIWPSWCYTGVGEADSEIKRGNTRMNGATVGGGGGTIEHLTSNNNNNNNNSSNNNNGSTNQNNNTSSNNNNNNNTVKAERLSPPTADNNSSSSRSGTPVSSYEGTPPTGLDRASSPHIKVMDQVMTRNYSDFMRSLAAKYNHANPNDNNCFSYFSTTTPGTGRNGFPGDPRFVGGFKTGAATPFVGLMAPLTGTPAPPTGGSTNSGPNTSSANIVSNNSSGASASIGNLKESSSNDAKSSPAAAEAPPFPNFSHNPFVPPPGVPPLFPPMIDMSSTQALLNMVRSASAHSANQLETYLKGAIKRGSENPLDLSASKKSRKSALMMNSATSTLSLGESLYGDALLGLPMFTALNRASKEHQQNRTQTKSPNKPVSSNNISGNTNNSGSQTIPSAMGVGNSILSGNTLNKNNLRNNLNINNRPQCLSMCNDKTLTCSSNNSNLVFNSNSLSTSPFSSNNNSGDPSITSWNVEDVVNYVSSIDICAEYAPNFREQRIDGSALPLLTEQHLTTALQMKLGPALKLRAILSRRLGHCAICLHCVHCHGSSAAMTTSAAIPPSPSPKPTVRPNSTGN
ncbi:SAM-motif ubiquitously expressed punctatedly localized protein [Lycorma delicatula]|uniref:SAM-motif ubiquitously expressed punctatedly localized protein n=1 Tax=Lycorma delicatula TaxID=130591 RepID=UPI003F518EA0